MPSPSPDIFTSVSPVANVILQPPTGLSIVESQPTTLNQTAYAYDESSLTYDSSSTYYNNTLFTDGELSPIGIDIIL